MKSLYENREGGYPAALLYAAETGGQLFPSRSKDGSSTVVKGRKVATFWEPNSAKRIKCQQYARELGFDPEHATPSRLCRWFLSKIVGLEGKGEHVNPRFLKLAKDGFHWHYTHVDVGYHPYLFEFDIKSAYITSLNSGESLKYDYDKGYLSDNGALDIIRTLSPSMPKWFRTTLLGVLGSHRLTFYTVRREDNNCISLSPRTVNKIDYPLAFQALHKSVLRLYRVMSAVHDAGRCSIARIHTDSFAVAASIPTGVEEQINNILESNGFQLQCKSAGSSHFFSLNEGIVGKKYIGCRSIIREQILSLPERPKRVSLDYQATARWSGHPWMGEFELPAAIPAQSTEAPQPQQLSLGIPMAAGEGRW